MPQYKSPLILLYGTTAMYVACHLFKHKSYSNSITTKNICTKCAIVAACTAFCNLFVCHYLSRIDLLAPTLV